MRSSASRRKRCVCALTAALRQAHALAQLLLSPHRLTLAKEKDTMSYAIPTIENHDQHIFEGLDHLSRLDSQLPAAWAHSLGEDELNGDFESRGVENARIDIEVECWGRRLA